MPLASEDSPEPAKTSNTPVGRSWSLLAGACRNGRPLDEPGHRTPPLLEAVLAATGAERAFVVHRGENDSTHKIEALCSRRRDGQQTPSRTLLLRALAGERSFLCTDLPGDALLRGCESVRRLSLRWSVTAPVDSTRASRSVLVLDGRALPRLAWAETRCVVEGFASVLAMARSLDAHQAAASSVRSPAEIGDTEPLGDTEWIRRAARSDLPVVVRGESGSGKERVARWIHRVSARGEGSFVAVSCTALNETLLDAELFGAVRGAYTGADRDRPGLFRLAHGGTLFLDEVGDMPLAMQGKLLRVLQERRVRPVGGGTETDVDVRIVCATHRDLVREVSAGRFRRDLYYRLSVVEVKVPPLRERLDELGALARSLAPGLERETGLGPLSVVPCAIAALQRFDWPGNVRELRSVLARALLRSGGRPITAREIGELQSIETVRPGEASDRPPALERRMIEGALNETADNILRAAERIGWTRQKLYRRMRALGIRRSSE